MLTALAAILLLCFIMHVIVTGLRINLNPNQHLTPFRRAAKSA